MPLMVMAWGFLGLIALMLVVWVVQGYRIELELRSIRELLERFEVIEVKEGGDKDAC